MPMYIVSSTVFLLQLRYRIVWVTALDLLVSRFSLWSLVALAPALFRSPWRLFHPIHLLLVTQVLYRADFSSFLYISKNNDPSCGFTQLQSSPMV
jgi:hypothetical protein